MKKGETVRGAVKKWGLLGLVFGFAVGVGEISPSWPAGPVLVGFFIFSAMWGVLTAQIFWEVRNIPPHLYTLWIGTPLLYAVIYGVCLGVAVTLGSFAGHIFSLGVPISIIFALTILPLFGVRLRALIAACVAALLGSIPPLWYSSGLTFAYGTAEIGVYLILVVGSGVFLVRTLYRTRVKRRAIDEAMFGS